MVVVVRAAQSARDTDKSKSHRRDKEKGGRAKRPARVWRGQPLDSPDEQTEGGTDRRRDGQGMRDRQELCRRPPPRRTAAACCEMHRRRTEGGGRGRVSMVDAVGRHGWQASGDWTGRVGQERKRAMGGGGGGGGRGWHTGSRFGGDEGLDLECLETVLRTQYSGCRTSGRCGVVILARIVDICKATGVWLRERGSAPQARRAGDERRQRKADRGHRTEERGKEERGKEEKGVAGYLAAGAPGHYQNKSLASRRLWAGVLGLPSRAVRVSPSRGSTSGGQDRKRVPADHWKEEKGGKGSRIFGSPTEYEVLTSRGAVQDRCTRDRGGKRQPENGL